MKKVIYSLAVGGIALLTLSFQNCAPSGFIPSTVNSSLKDLSSSGTDTVTIPSTDSAATLKVRNLSVSLTMCASDSSQLALEVIGGGPDLAGCAEAYIDGRDNSFRCSDSSYKSLSSIPEWRYNSANDVWSFGDKLKNHPTFVPGRYISFFKSKLGTFPVGYEIQNPSGSTCQASSSSSTDPGAGCTGFQQAKAQCDSTSSKDGRACYVRSQTGESLYYAVGVGPAAVVQVQCVASGGGGTVTPTPTPAPIAGTKYKDGVIVKNQYGRVYVKKIAGGDHFDYSSNGSYDLISYEFDSNSFLRGGIAMTLANIASVGYNGSSQQRTMTLSTVPGDTSSTLCKTTLGSEVSKWVSFDNRGAACKIQTGVTYYFTVSSPMACASDSERCRFHFVSNW